jgi:hypothetical protein
MRAFAAAGGAECLVPLATLATGAVVSFALAARLFAWDGNNSGSGGKRLLALLALVPYAATLLIA